MDTEKARADWLAERRTMLTASDCAAVLGLDDRRGPFQVYLSKVEGLEAGETEWMAFGRDVESAIVKGYERRTGRETVDHGPFALVRHPDIPWLGATPDREVFGSKSEPAPNGLPSSGSLEAKAIAVFLQEDWREEPPIAVQIQNQIQMACTGSLWGSVVALIGGVEIAWKDTRPHPGFLKKALPKLEEFWSRVQRREPPDPDEKPGTLAALKAAYPEDNGETIVLTEEIMPLVKRWEEAGIRKAAAVADEKRTGAILRARLGSATFGALPDETFLTLKTTKRRGYEVQPTSFRVLRRYIPKTKKGRK